MKQSHISNEVVPYRATQALQYQTAAIWKNVPLWHLLWSHPTALQQKVAIRDDHESLTYEELMNQADQLAQGLIEDGWKSGDHIVIQLSNTCYFSIVFFGLLRAGIIPVLALPAHGLKEIEHFMSISKAKGYIGEEFNDNQIFKVLKEKGLSCIYLINSKNKKFSLPNFFSPNFIPVDINPDTTAIFLVSGGTTGLPKLIPRTHNDYLYNINCCCKASAVSEHEVYLAVLPAAHNFTLGCPGFLGTLSKGGQVIFSQIASPDHCFDLIEQFQITATALVPALAQLWTEATQWEDATLASLKRIQVGGAKLTYRDALAIQETIPGALQQVFGMAEGLIACTRLTDPPEVVASMQGKPVSQFDEIRVVDKDGNEVTIGEEGELLVRGPYTLRGYYNAPEYNTLSFSDDGFYCSGDKVRIDKEQYITVTGRIKDVINRAGECIASDEIEDLLLAHPQIIQAAVIAIPDQHLGERIGAAIVGHGEQITLQEIREFLLKQNLARFKMPDELLLLPTLPKTAVGKIDKKAIIGPTGSLWHQNSP
ncbi:(2,3-dihydroxybenzoyl)adenylate synthase [Vibrio hepatarius]|uniref:(2,3-dihydroxybenzoyl)adenylate synthase n=1 Tax=Vibrio hepatarius TaxID=171383 RepID=UPI001C0A3B74|nr:AMP-binding protein [Vibrio hepatarius]MBU2898688.1 AMP-binding protein [Vibrio hepatarius]